MSQADEVFNFPVCKMSLEKIIVYVTYCSPVLNATSDTDTLRLAVLWPYIYLLFKSLCGTRGTVWFGYPRGHL